METINIQLQVPNTGKYSLDEFIAKVKEYAEKLSDTLTTPVKSYRETYMTRKEQEAYVAESLNRALDQMVALKKSGGARVITYNLQQIGEIIQIDLLTIYDKSEIPNASDDFIEYLLANRSNLK